jgi:Tol biopolymer transport system component
MKDIDWEAGITMQLKKGKCWLRAILVLLAVALCAGSIGCGSGSSDPKPIATPTPQPSPTPVPNPTPAIVTIAPNSAPAGALAFTLTVSGSNFLPASQVQWNGSSRTTTFVSSTQLQAHIMAADLAAAGKVSVTVLNPAPGGGASNVATFSVPAAMIAFRSARALDGSDARGTNGAENIWVMNPDGSGQVSLTKLNTTSVFNPVWSPDGSKIAFESARALDGSDAANTNFTFNIWVMDANGGNLRPLTRITASQGGSSSPKWSRDGSKIAFESRRALDGSDAGNTNSTLNIWVMNADGSGATPLTRRTAVFADSEGAAFSPDGSKIAFESGGALDGSDAASTNHIFNIWVMNADGTGATPLTRLTAPGSHSTFPAFSPDGSKIAFQSERALDASDAANGNNTANLWTMNRDGSGPGPITRLTVFGADCTSFAWSPDGSKLTFESARALDGSDALGTIFTSNIFTVRADGSSLTPLTKLTTLHASSVSPIWSPDGNKVIFVSLGSLDGSDAVNTNFGANIWVVNADGSGAKPLTRLTNAQTESPNIP